MFRKGLSLLAGLSFAPLALDSQTSNPDSHRHAICILYPNDSLVRGIVSFSQENLTTSTRIACFARGLKSNGTHGIHIHEYGDLT
jgi:Cu/Zn superoxide dismutase